MFKRFVFDEFLCRRKADPNSQTSEISADNFIVHTIFRRGRRESERAGKEKEEGLLRTVG